MTGIAGLCNETMLEYNRNKPTRYSNYPPQMRVCKVVFAVYPNHSLSKRILCETFDYIYYRPAKTIAGSLLRSCALNPFKRSLKVQVCTLYYSLYCYTPHTHVSHLMSNVRTPQPPASAANRSTLTRNSIPISGDKTNVSRARAHNRTQLAAENICLLD